jgi:Uma2 family endonuclease
MSAPVKTRVSEEVYLATMTGERPSLEFVNGEVFPKPMVKLPHHEASVALTERFLAHRRQHGGTYAYEATTNLSERADRRYRVPDGSYWAPGRPVATDDGVFLPSTLAIEIRFEGQSMNELREKCREYRARGIDAAWLIDPERRRVEVFEDERDAEPLAADASLESRYVPGFSLPVASLWS